MSSDFPGNVTSDATNSLQSSYNLINLPSQIKSGSTVKANYTYLSDGTKAAAYTSASAGKDYVGSFAYTRGSGGSKILESVAFGTRHPNGLTQPSALLVSRDKRIRAILPPTAGVRSLSNIGVIQQR